MTKSDEIMLKSEKNSKNATLLLKSVTAMIKKLQKSSFNLSNLLLIFHTVLTQQKFESK